jgi:mannose-6-phosphate isomerase
MLSLNCPVQTYSWGKIGNDSLVARLKSSALGTFKLQDDQYYAELWMGTHPSGPAILSEDGTLLSSLLLENPSLCGQVPQDYLPSELAFLFKVLSVRTALSIQAHPDRQLAQHLHQLYPEIYKDANHKPEMVIALTSFECLCGFRHVRDICEMLQAYPELNRFLSESGFAWMEHQTVTDEEFLRQMFCTFTSVQSPLVNDCLHQMISRIRSITSDKSSELEELLLRLYEQYPDDIGVFAPLILNVINLRPGESFFIGPNIPHAYLSGDCVECMALSDNVVRAGLTPKYKDVATLTSMLTYTSGPPSFLVPLELSKGQLLYRPPVQLCAEFEVEKIDIRSGTKTPLLALPAASIILVTGDSQSAEMDVSSSPNLSLTVIDDSSDQSFGVCKKSIQAKIGSVIFIAAGAHVKVVCEDEAASYVLFRAHVNLGSA